MIFSLGPRATAAGYRLASFDSIGSTNAEALARARTGERGKMWFVTDCQTAGRGRRNREWIAPKGNLASSVLTILDVTPAVAATLGFAAGLALADALRRVSAEVVMRAPGSAAAHYRLKWPNDVLAGTSKLAGILLEAEPLADGRLAVVVGIGTNVVASPGDTPYPATSLAALGVLADAAGLFGALSESWSEMFEMWDNGRGFRAIRERWLAYAAGLGESVSIRSGDAVVSGMFETIDDSGCMMLRTSDRGLVAVAAGDVYFGAIATAGAA